MQTIPAPSTNFTCTPQPSQVLTPMQETWQDTYPSAVCIERALEILRAHAHDDDRYLQGQTQRFIEADARLLAQTESNLVAAC